MVTNIEEQKVLAQPKAEKSVASVGFERVFVAVNYLDSTPEIFEQALALAKANGSRLLVFYCSQEQIAQIPEMSFYTAGMGAYVGVYSDEMLEVEKKLLEEAMEEIKAWLGDLTKQAQNEGVEAESDYGVGDAGHQICQFAQQWQADLIVIGRRGRTGISELVLGSVSNYVVHHAHCSVLVIQH